MNEKQLDYLFDLQGYLVLRNAISQDDLREMNQWVDDHWSYVEAAQLPGNNTGSNQLTITRLPARRWACLPPKAGMNPAPDSSKSPQRLKIPIAEATCYC